MDGFDMLIQMGFVTSRIITLLTDKLFEILVLNCIVFDESTFYGCCKITICTGKFLRVCLYYFSLKFQVRRVH